MREKRNILVPLLRFAEYARSQLCHHSGPPSSLSPGAKSSHPTSTSFANAIKRWWNPSYHYCVRVCGDAWKENNPMVGECLSRLGIVWNRQSDWCYPWQGRVSVVSEALPDTLFAEEAMPSLPSSRHAILTARNTSLLHPKYTKYSLVPSSIAPDFPRSGCDRLWSAMHSNVAACPA